MDIKLNEKYVLHYFNNNGKLLAIILNTKTLNFLYRSNSAFWIKRSSYKFNKQIYYISG